MTKGKADPSGDARCGAVGLGRWFELLRNEKSYPVELSRNSNQASETVLSFGFDYCRIDPSRFG